MSKRKTISIASILIGAFILIGCFVYFKLTKDKFNTAEEAAEISQKTLDDLYYTDELGQFINNIYPLNNSSENNVFNYWWLAHLVDVKLDGYLRTGDEDYLIAAEEAMAYNKLRNQGTLIHEFYDDMLWNALAALRLYDVTGKEEYLNDGIEVCDDIFATGGNQIAGGGYAWKRTQLSYKNTPVNGPLMILALRLYQINNNQDYLSKSKEVLDWMRATLVNPETKFVYDGINRNDDGLVDSDWKFTYNQGVYIGALLEFYNIENDQAYLEEACQVADTALATFVVDGVIDESGEGGDLGLFKGIFYRYLGNLSEAVVGNTYRDFILSSTEILVENSLHADSLLTYRDWTVLETPEQVELSDQLSGVMALETAAKLSR